MLEKRILLTGREPRVRDGLRSPGAGSMGGDGEAEHRYARDDLQDPPERRGRRAGRDVRLRLEGFADLPVREYDNPRDQPRGRPLPGRRGPAGGVEPDAGSVPRSPGRSVRAEARSPCRRVRQGAAKAIGSGDILLQAVRADQRLSPHHGEDRPGPGGKWGAERRRARTETCRSSTGFSWAAGRPFGGSRRTHRSQGRGRDALGGTYWCRERGAEVVAGRGVPGCSLHGRG